MSTTEIAASLDFIKSKLTANVALVSLAIGGFHQGAAPVGTPAPWVAYSYQSGRDVTTFNAVRLFSSLLFLVKAVGPQAMQETLFEMAALIDDEMGRAGPEAVTGAVIGAYFREEPFHMDETRSDGASWSHCGGLYRAHTEQA